MLEWRKAPNSSKFYWALKDCMGLVAEGDIKVLIDEWEYTTSGWRMDRRKVVSVKLLRSGHLYECAPRQVLDHYGVHYEETQAH